MNRWIIGARPRTLPAAVVPVAIGAACAVGIEEDVVWWRVAMALIVSLALQVGVNYANDYSDGVRGTDDVRVGPQRLVASGLASAGSVKRAAFVAFGIAAVAGLAVALTTSLWLLVVGVAAIAAGWFYTGGSHPYGYMGLGEVFVFVFFGLVATVGTTYAAVETITGLSIVMSSAAGSAISEAMSNVRHAGCVTVGTGAPASSASSGRHEPQTVPAPVHWESFSTVAQPSRHAADKAARLTPTQLHTIASAGQ